MADNNLPVPVEAQAAGASDGKSTVHDLRMSFFEHLGELRKRLMWSAAALVVCAGVVWNFQQPVFEYLLRPLLSLNVKIILLTPLEMFLTYIKIAIMGGAMLSAPFILLQLWLFVSPGLYSHEKRWVFPFIFSGSAFFVGGAAFCFYLVLPATFKFMTEMVPMMTDLKIENQYSVGAYFSLVIQLMLAFGAVFELPLIMVILAAAGLVTAKQFGAFRKYWVVIAAIIGGILTPTPDPMTQMMMAAPLYGFYELGIFASRFVEGRRRTADPAPPAAG